MILVTPKCVWEGGWLSETAIQPKLRNVQQITENMNRIQDLKFLTDIFGKKYLCDEYIVYTICKYMREV